MSRVLNIISQIIALSKEAKIKAEQNDIEDSKRILKIIIGLEEEELKYVEDESGSKELYQKCVVLYAEAKNIIKEEYPKEKILQFLEKIIELEKTDLSKAIKGKQGLLGEVLKIIDPYIRRLIQKINKLSFVNTTHYSCSGHFPYRLRAYIRIDYDTNSQTKHNIHTFHNALMGIVNRTTEPFLKNSISGLFGQHNFECGYYMSAEGPKSVEEIKQQLINQWKAIERVVEKYKDEDVLIYKRQKSQLKEPLLDDDAIRMVYCPKCDKYVYTDRKNCTGCGTDMRVLKLQG